MKQFHLLMACLCLFGTMFSFAGTIKGRVLDHQQQPVEFATITLFNAADSSLVKGDFTDQSGSFSIEHVENGKYLLTITDLGYEKISRPDINLDENNPSVDLGNISLAPEAKEISGVTVTAQKPMIQHDRDKMILNIEGSPIASGGSVMDALEKAPGVIVDQDGNISLRGKQGVLVLIDDKPTYLSAEQLSNQLKGMPADAVSKIEVITNPSARYDAEGNAGIINIVTKKNKNLGLNGSVNAGLERSSADWSPEAGINLNYRVKKVNLFGSYNYSDYPQLQTLDVVRNFNTDGIQSSVTEKSTMDNHYIDNSYKAGIDYFLNDRNTIGFVASGYIDKYTSINNTSAIIYNSNGVYEPSSNTYGDLDNTSNNYSFNLNYDGKLDTSGTTLSVDADFSRFDGKGDDHYVTTFYNEDGSETDSPLLYYTQSPGVIDIRSAKIDFSHSFKMGWNFEAGAKTSDVKNDNEEIFSVQQNDVWVIDSTKTNHFIYEENIYAGYVQMSKEFKNISVQAGLRGELTDAHGNSKTLNETFKRNYFQLFPSLNVTDKINDKHSLSLSYSRRIDRPRYDQLNPSLFFLDPYLYQQGNPNLKPQLTHSLELTYLFKESYTFSFNYSRTTDELPEQLYQTDSTKTIVLLSDNFGVNTTYSMTAYAPLQPVKWWSVTPVVTAFYQDLQTEYLETTFHNTNFGYQLNIQNSFSLPKGFSIELSAQYQSQVIFSIAGIEPNGDVSVGVKKSFLDGKATVKLNARDIFNTNNVEGDINYANINSYFRQNNDRQRYGINFSYRFGNSQASQRQRQNGIEEEKNRVKRAG
ncbi:MAG TPA: TonB-dependent receptor [Chitinophagales bacterium]|nr:TonB-dependent receptor [Chitinophagales bacterium]